MVYPTQALFEARLALQDQVESGAIARQQMFEQALELDADDAIALTELAGFRLDAGDLPGAEDYCWRAATADPRLPKPWFRLGQLMQGRSESESMISGVMELTFRKSARDEAAVQYFAKSKLAELMPGPVTRETLEVAAEAMTIGNYDEPQEVTDRLTPHRQIDELLEDANRASDPDLVAAIVNAGPPRIPHLLGVVRGTPLDAPEEDLDAAVKAVAIIGEIGDLAPLPEILECIVGGDDDISAAAAWAVERIAERQPEATFEALRKLAAVQNVELRAAIAMAVHRLPSNLPGQLEFLESLLVGMEGFPAPERADLFMNVAETLVVQHGTRGVEHAHSLYNRYSALLPKKVKADLRKAIQRAPDIQGIRELIANNRLTVYDFCCPEDEYDDAEDSEFEEGPDSEEEIYLPPPPPPPAPPRVSHRGRNDPCWCGSGKKYKKCHLEADEKARQEYAEVLPPPPDPARENKIVDAELRGRLGDFTTQVLSEREYGDALNIFMGDHTPKDIEQTDLMAEFMDWLVHDYALPRNGRTIIAEFIRRRPALTMSERAMLEAWDRSRYSLHEVQSTQPGTGLVLKDLLLGTEHFVHDVSLSKSSARWDCYLSRVEETDGRMLVHGVLRLVPRGLLPELMEWAHSARELSGLDWEGFLRANGYKLRQEVFALSEDLEANRMMVSAEGDDIMFSKAVFDVLDDAALRRALDTAEGIEPHDTNEYAWVEPEELETGGRRALGSLTIADGRLTLDCMTRQRIERGKEMLQRLAGAALRHKGDQFTSMESALRKKGNSPPSKPVKPVPPEVANDIMQKAMAKHYQNWPDTPLPYLDGKTPRQAADKPASRARLVDLLKMMENGEERKRQDGHPWFDFAPIKKELGVEY